MDIIWAFEMMMVRERAVRRAWWDKGNHITWEDGVIWFHFGTTRASDPVDYLMPADLTAEDWVEWDEV